MRKIKNLFCESMVIFLIYFLFGSINTSGQNISDLEKLKIVPKSLTPSQKDCTTSEGVSPMKVQLKVLGQLGLNQTTNILCIVTTVDDAPKTKVIVELSDGLISVGGEIHWEGFLKAGKSVQFSFMVKIVQTGMLTIAVKAKSPFDEEFWFGDVSYLYLNVSESAVDVSTSPIKTQPPLMSKPAVPVNPNELQHILNKYDFLPNKPNPEAPPTLRRTIPFFDQSNTDSLEKNKMKIPMTSGLIKVKGYFYYQNRNNQVVSAKWVTIEIWDKDALSSDDFLGYALTDETGYFESSWLDNNDPEWGTQDIYVRFIASNSAALVNDASNSVYDAFPANSDGTIKVWENATDNTTINVGSWRPPDTEKRAWQIFYSILDGWNYLSNNGPDYNMSLSTVRWPYETWPHYHQGGQIHLPDNDAADSPDVIVHEYGHNVMYEAYGNTFPQSNCPDPHYINSVSSANCAWTEGWANFFPLAVYNNPAYAYQNHYNINFENYTGSTFQDGDNVEGRVAGALYDIFDSNNDGTDSFSDGITNIWYVFDAQNVNTFSDYWNQWRNGTNNASRNKHLAIKAIFQNTIDYNQSPLLSGLPDKTLQKNSSINHAIDLWDYASDNESSDEQLIFTISSNTNSSVGVSIETNRYVNINPANNWTGNSDVTIAVSDGLKIVSDIIKITVTDVSVQITIASNPTGRTFTVDGTNYTSQQTFQWSQGSNHPISTTSPQSGGTGTQYLWSNWSDGGGMSHSITVPSIATTYTVNFLTQYYLTINDSPQGKATLNISSNWYTKGDQIIIQATPSIGYSFSSWSGSGSGSYTGSNNPANITMNGAISETAILSSIPPSCYTLTTNVNQSGSGNISVNTSPNCSGGYSPNTQISLTATPNSGYTFINWTENGTVLSTNSSYNFTISSNRTLVANFTLILPSTSASIKPVSPAEVSPGTEFWVEIKVGDPNAVTNLFGASFILNYNTTYLDHVSSESMSWFGTDLIFLPNNDELAGRTSIGISRKNPASGINGSGVIARIKYVLNASVPNNTVLNFTLTELTATDHNNTPITLNPIAASSNVISGISVWSGDTNNDGKVDQADVLPLGIHWNKTGAARQNASTQWVAQSCTPWSPQTATYADANGSGKVDQGDVLPIGQNWGKTHTVNKISLTLSEEINHSYIVSLEKENGVAEKNEYVVNISYEQIDRLLPALRGLSFVVKYDASVEKIELERGNYFGKEVIDFANDDESRREMGYGIARVETNSQINDQGIILKLRIKAKEGDGEIAIENIEGIDVLGNKVMIESSNLKVNMVELKDEEIASGYRLEQNYPNPFNPTTTIEYLLKKDGYIRLGIFNALGQEVMVLREGYISAGRYKAIFDGKDFPSGNYFYKLKTSEDLITRKMTLIK